MNVLAIGAMRQCQTQDRVDADQCENDKKSDVHDSSSLPNSWSATFMANQTMNQISNETMPSPSHACHMTSGTPDVATETDSGGDAQNEQP